MDYKVGDMVRIKDLRRLPTRVYDGCTIVDDMLQYANKDTEIKEIFYNTNYKLRFKLSIDKNSWSWAIDMFEPIDVKQRKERYR